MISFLISYQLCSYKRGGSLTFWKIWAYSFKQSYSNIEKREVLEMKDGGGGLMSNRDNQLSETNLRQSETFGRNNSDINMQTWRHIGCYCLFVTCNHMLCSSWLNQYNPQSQPHSPSHIIRTPTQIVHSFIRPLTYPFTQYKRNDSPNKPTHPHSLIHPPKTHPHTPTHPQSLTRRPIIHTLLADSST